MITHLANTEDQHGLVAIGLHWIMAAMVIGMFLLGWYMTGLEYVDPWYTLAPHLHESFGLIVLALLVMRTVWTLANKKPELVPMPAWERLAAVTVQRLFYLLLFGVTISGYLIPTADGRGIDLFNWGEVPAVISYIGRQEEIAGVIHRVAAWGTIALVLLHSLAALKHHFIDGDDTLLRMLGIVPRNS